MQGALWFAQGVTRRSPACCPAIRPATAQHPTTWRVAVLTTWLVAVLTTWLLLYSQLGLWLSGLQEVEYVKEEAKLVYLLECLQKTPPPVLIFAGG